MKKWHRVTSLVLAVTLLATVTAGCGKKPENEAVATVNGEEITRGQLDKRLNKMEQVYKGQGLDFSTEQGKYMKQALERQLLDGMVEENILLQEAKKQGVLPSDAAVTAKVKETKDKFPSEAEFNKALKDYNMDIKEFEDWTRQNLALDALFNKVTKNITVSDAQIKKYYDDNQASFKQGEQVRVRHILIKFDTAQEKVGRTDAQAKKEILAILDQINKGADFATLAKEKSEDTGSKDKGGEYTFSRGQMVKEFEDAAYSLKVGQITQQPVKTIYGYHIIKLEEKIPAKQRTFDEVKDELKSSLPLQKKQEAFTKFTNDLKKSAKIDIKLPPLQAVPAPGMGGASSGGASGSGSSSSGGAAGQKPANHP